MSLTTFPFEQDKPQINVTLPVGTHVLELVVEDSAGAVSDPVTIVVIVEPDPGTAPLIADFAPRWLLVGEEVKPFLIKGERLCQKTADLTATHTLKFLLPANDEVDPAITAIIQPESTVDTLLVDVVVTDGAQPGDRRLQLTTPQGKATLDTPLFQVK